MATIMDIPAYFGAGTGTVWPSTGFGKIVCLRDVSPALVIGAGVGTDALTIGYHTGGKYAAFFIQTKRMMSYKHCIVMHDGLLVGGGVDPSSADTTSGIEVRNWKDQVGLEVKRFSGQTKDMWQLTTEGGVPGDMLKVDVLGNVLLNNNRSLSGATLGSAIGISAIKMTSAGGILMPIGGNGIYKGGNYIIFRDNKLHIYGNTNSRDYVTFDKVNERVGIGPNATSPDYALDVKGSFGFAPGVSVAPANNGDVVIEFTDNTTLTFKGKGTDGTVRSATLTLA